MRMLYLKFAGIILWGLFLFVPFIARADEGFDTYFPILLQQDRQKDAGVIFSLGGREAQWDGGNAVKMQVEDKWALRFNAGKDTVLTNDLSPDVRHDRLPLDDGGRTSFRFGIGLNYTF